MSPIRSRRQIVLLAIRRCRRNFSAKLSLEEEEKIFWNEIQYSHYQTVHASLVGSGKLYLCVVR